MSNSRIPSPARSQGAPITPRRYKSRTRSVGSPARSTTSGRLSALVQFKENNKDSFVVSPAPSRRSVLNDDTEIEEPRRRSWWKKLDDNSRDVMEVLNDNKVLETNEAVEEYIDIEVLSQEKKNYTVDIPDSSDNESISSIVIPQRKLFTQKDQAQNKFGQLVGTRETLAKLHKSNVADKSVHVAPKNLFGQGTKPRSKPVFQAALLNLSPNKTANKTKENIAAEPKGQVRSLFGNRAGTKRKNMFADFIVSESEDEISEIQPKVFGFPKKPDTRRDSANSRGKREHSPTSSITTDNEMDDWKMLPSSTLVENQIEDMMVAAKTPVKRPRLSNLAETKESEIITPVDQNDKEPSDEEQELKYDDEDDKSDKNDEQNNVEHILDINEHAEDQHNSIQENKTNNTVTEDKLNESRSKPHNLSQQKHGTSLRKIHDVSKNKSSVEDQAKKMGILSEQALDNGDKTLIEKNKSHRTSKITSNENNEIKERIEIIKSSEDKSLTKQVGNNIDNINQEMDIQNNVDEVDNREEMEVEDNHEGNLNQIQKEEAIITHKDRNKSKTNDNQVSDQNNIKNNVAQEKSDNIIETAEVSESEKDNNVEENDGEMQESKVHNDSNIEEQKSEIELEKGNSRDKNEEEEIDNESDNEQENKVVSAVEEESEAEQNESEMEVQNESVLHDQEEKEHSSLHESGAKSQNENANEQSNGSIAEAEEELEENGRYESEKEELEDNETHESEQEELENEEEHESEQEELENEEEHESEQEELENENEHESEQEELENEVEHDNEQEELENEVEHDNEQEELENEHESEEVDLAQEDENEELEGNEEQNNSTVNNEEDAANNESNLEIQEESAEFQEETEDDAQHESVEVQDENDTDNESAEINDEVEDNNENESEEEQDENEELQNESSEIQDQMEEDHNESAELQYDSEEEQQNQSHEAAEESEDEIQDSNDQQESDNDNEQRNETHDTTGRYRKKNETEVNSPEAILHDKTNQLESFTAQGRNTSVRKTTMLKNLNIRPSLAPPRESTGLSDGTRNSSAEGSGWDSHRTTRKTLRQTFGRDFTPRKSLRALVMEKSAKRQTAVNELTSVTAKFPQANSTELPEASMAPDDSDIATESIHDVSKRTRQTTLEMYLQKIKKQNLERKLKMEEEVRNSLKAPTRDVVNPFKVPFKPLFSSRKPSKTASKTKAKQVKSALIPLDDLPAEVVEDMKYKPPRRFQPSNASWITKRLYKFLESKLEPKYDYKARVRAEKLVETIYHFAKDLRRVEVAPVVAVDALKQEMARLDVVRTHFDFYQFFHEYMPREIRVKVVPDVVNKINVPRHGVFSDIIRGNTVQG